MLELVAYGRFLCNATQSPETFDFSLAYAIVDWIRTSISKSQEASCGVSEVVSGVNAFESVISMTSGKGLTEIWRGLSAGTSSSADGGMVQHLDSADRRLHRSPGDFSTSVPYPIQHAIVRCLYAL